jgi:hypothetical protein
MGSDEMREMEIERERGGKDSPLIFPLFFTIRCANLR